jgi:CubicO group peptidase (beta-lactamase class C family)
MMTRVSVRFALLSLVVLAVFVGAGPAVGGEGEDRAAAARTALEGFDSLVHQAIADFNVPGLGIAVVAGGEVVYAEGFGFRDVKNELPMTPDSLFAIGSTTKAMTVTVLGMLVDEGKLDWDTPLRTYLPGFRLSDPLTTERITPRDLVTHRSGLPRHDMVWYNNSQSTRPEVVAQLAYLELTEDLRAKFQYNNLMYMTAGYLTGQLSGTTWEELVRERLFEPLGMRRTNFSVEDSKTDSDHALPYRENDDDEIERIPFRNIDLVGPAGSVNSSVNEMARWLLFNLHGGTFDGQQLINATTLADIHSPHMTTGETPDRSDISVSTYGMGWGITTYRGHRRISHGGGIDGFITSVMFFPDADLGLVAFNNRGSGLPRLVAQHAADRILGLEEVDWIGEALEERRKAKAEADQAAEKKEATRVAGTSASHPLADYAGSYLHPGYGSLRVSVAGETLELTYNDITTPLEHWHYDVWSGIEGSSGDTTFEDEKFIFRSNVEGLIAAVEARFEPRGEPIAFVKQTDARLSDPEHLKGFVGTYETATGMQLQIELSGRSLTLTIPGEQLMTLEPNLSGRFVIKEYRVLSLGFELDDHGRAIKAILYQPDGVYEAPRID